MQFIVKIETKLFFTSNDCNINTAQLSQYAESSNNSPILFHIPYTQKLYRNWYYKLVYFLIRCSGMYLHIMYICLFCAIY